MTKDKLPNNQGDPQLAFTAFGRVFAKVAAFEQFMRVALAHRVIESGDYAKLNEHDKKAKSDSFLRMDFARLQQRISGQFCRDDNDKAIFKDARDIRNYLAHNFWQHSFHFLHSSRGIFLIEQNCAQIELQFDVVCEHLIKLTGTDFAHYTEWVKEQSLTDEQFDEYESLIGEGWQAHLDAGHITIFEK